MSRNKKRKNKTLFKREELFRCEDLHGNLLRLLTREELDFLVERKAPIEKVGKSTYREIPPIATSNSQNSQVMLNRGDMNVLAGLHFSESTATRRQVERLIGWGLVTG